ncbi:Pentatricopeptide repeat-containing protein [Quillaja saponaria]|uniref:Pentatricopeptide repeat-containing protein n=1 Tax=Quillaja saponaria TaxID=32244 RepID=A0AAD7LGF9_QUISA|nr:Pentatricopeptide repeat-containing protein [Quillaja saponaria]
MGWRTLVSRQTIHKISRNNGKTPSPYAYICRNLSTIISPTPTTHFDSSTAARILKCPNPISSFNRYIHSTQETRLSNLVDDAKLDSEEDDGTINEFLSRLVWIMRGKLSEVYPDCDKQTIDGMLMIIVSKVVSELEKCGLEQMLDAAVVTPSQDFSEDLWKTVWEVSNMVLDDMNKEKKKEKMKSFLHAEEVKQMCRFAGEIGIRGDLLRELRFKWAREAMEKSEFYESLKRLKEEERSQNKQEEAEVEEAVLVEAKPDIVTLPRRRGKIKYKIYGLDLSDRKWAEVADKIHETGEFIWPQEPKPISGKCKLVTERILSLNEDGDPSPLLAEWVELLQPTRSDWMALLDRLKERNSRSYFRVAELALTEESFQTNVRDYSELIDIHAKENRLDDAERILKKMNDKGIAPDILTDTVLVHMYSKAGNLERANKAFESLRSQGFEPDMNLYNSMIMAYVNTGEPKMGENLMREMEARDIKPTEEMYMALLRSFSKLGIVDGAGRISNTMQFAGFEPSLESCTLLVEACAKVGDPDQARSNFDHMLKLGHKPDDRCTASMIAAYESKNSLDKALNLLLQLEGNGFQPGVATYTVLVDWLGKLQLVDEAEHLLSKIAQLGEAPPLKVHVSLCDMYARARFEKKALQALGVLESKKEKLGADEFERIIAGLSAGGFVQDARRILGLMEDQGYAASGPLKMTVMEFKAFPTKRPGIR